MQPSEAAQRIQLLLIYSMQPQFCLIPHIAQMTGLPPSGRAVISHFHNHNGSLQGCPTDLPLGPSQYMHNNSNEHPSQSLIRPPSQRHLHVHIPSDTIDLLYRCICSNPNPAILSWKALSASSITLCCCSRLPLAAAPARHWKFPSSSGLPILPPLVVPRPDFVSCMGASF